MWSSRLEVLALPFAYAKSVGIGVASTDAAEIGTSNQR